MCRCPFAHKKWAFAGTYAAAALCSAGVIAATTQMGTMAIAFDAMTSKIINIIDGFPADHSEQTVLVYGKLKTLFGDSLYEEEEMEELPDSKSGNSLFA